jgi:hypothetical protein
MISASRSRRRGLAVAVALAVGLSACSGGSGKGAKKPSGPATLELKAGTVSVDSAGSPAAIPNSARDQIVTTVNHYVTQGILEPIETGKPVGDLSPLFTADALARLGGPDRAVLLDEQLPKPTGRVTASASPVDLVGLADAAGTVVFVSARLGVDIGAKSATGPVRVQRLGDLVLAPAAGGWRIFGYDLGVSRTGAGLDSGPKKAKK